MVVLDRARDARPGLLVAAARVLTWVALGLIPIVFTVAVLLGSRGNEAGYGFELRGNLLQPGERILAGDSPYEPELVRLGRERVEAGQPPRCCLQALYPAPTHVTATPLALLPFEAAMLVFTCLSVGALFLAFRLVGLRDWRCYGLLFLTPPIVHSLSIGTVTTFVLLATALTWRYRDSPARAGLGVAFAVLLKVYMWPLLVWLLLTRRFRAAGVAVAATVTTTLAGWAVIRFEDFTTYPSLLRDLAVVERDLGYSVVGAGMDAGLPPGAAQALAIAVAVALVAVGASRGDRSSFGFTVAAALVATPIVWQSYFAVVPLILALAAPRLSPGWIALALLWIRPIEEPVPSAVLTALAALALALVVLYRSASRPARAARAERALGPGELAIR